MKGKFRVRRTTLLSLGLAGFLFGLIVARWQEIWLSAEWLVLILPFIFMLRRKNLLSVIAVLMIGYTFGLWRGGMVLSQISRYTDYYGDKIVVMGQVQNDPVYDERGQLDFRVANVKVGEDKLPGQIRIRGFVNDVRRGDGIEVAGNLQTGFGNYQGSISFAEIKVTSRSASWLEKFRRDFFASTYSVLPEPQASLGLGFLVGLRSALPEDFDEQLRIVGLTHIVVASGYNLTILVRISRRLLAKRSKYQAFAGSVALVLGFIAITGASASITRAAVVTLLSLAAWYYGRKIHPVLIILLGAALTAGVSPVFIWHDLGWWLSFLAFTGVLILAPLITRLAFSKKSPPLLMQVGVETLSAQVLALPLIMYVFGDFSMVALIANLAVVPLIPFAMIGVFAGGLAGLVSTVIGAWVAVPANLILSYVVQITQLLASPSWAKQEVSLSTLGMVMIYLTVVAVGFGIYRRTGLRFRETPSVVE